MGCMWARLIAGSAPPPPGARDPGYDEETVGQPTACEGGGTAPGEPGARGTGDAPMGMGRAEREDGGRPMVMGTVR